METILYSLLDTPIGGMLLACSSRGVVRLYFPFPGDTLKILEREFPDWELKEDTAAIAGAAAQILEYFAGSRREFRLALDLNLTPFRSRVLELVRSIPFGKTESYGSLARRLGRPGAARAVGGANHANPVPLIIPCHRVVGSDGSLVGFGGGLSLKRKLLDWEMEVLHAQEDNRDPAPDFPWHPGLERAF